MKIHLLEIFVLMLFLLGCANTSVPTSMSIPDTAQALVVATSTVSPTASTSTPSPAVTQYPSTSTFIPAKLPDDLVVSYIAEDSLWVWKQNSSQLLLQQQNISDPALSDDGQWILFRQRHISLDVIAPPFDELWVVRTDGSELHRLLGPDDLVALTGEEAALFIYDANWLPKSHRILFNTERVIPNSPGSIPLFDLYSLDISGQVTRLVKAGSGGKFSISPTGTHVALMTNSRIDVLDLRSSKKRTLLEFKPLLIPSETMFIARVAWDPQGGFAMTAIPPQKLYYSDYAGEPVQVWRLFVNGQTELITEFQPFIPNPGVTFSLNLQYFFYLNNSCFDKMGMLTVRNLTSDSETSLFCVWQLPQWTPDSEHFTYELNSLWQLNSISDNTNQPLDVLNVPTDPDAHISPQLTWINDEYFLLVLRSSDVCTLSVATLQGVVTEITRTSPDVCPRGIDFSLN